MNNSIKQILVQLAIDGKLPLDMNELDENIFSAIPNNVIYDELISRKYIPEFSFTINDVDNLDTENELTLEEKYEILNNVMSNEVLMEKINIDLESEFENYIDKK